MNCIQVFGKKTYIHECININKSKNATQKTKMMTNAVPPKPGVNPGAREE
jgi:hypothetical protein